ncbi:MAG: nitroreductase family protein [Atopobiaceae bacterium]|jgi:nitroreductase|nr:nitroreductase family protein [Atopobiaceae bacterium]MCH4180138.1 nitroreductase family protein [Atopobiaceae bacterium]MCH4213810.1 nitroreductase family protein [Atopobiaceae bacterium]MCH4229805.1 nitroreductase family protein [Atopobiaceae bacterium]MCH4275727.1 nitroreductase family protein [Atopobiaceae bacterium]
MPDQPEPHIIHNQVTDQLRARVSVRAFTDRPVDDTVRASVLDAGTQAPTAGDQQLYTIIDVHDQAEKDTLSRLCDNQPFIAHAPMVLILVADCHKWPATYEVAGACPRQPGVGDLMLAVEDAAIAAQNVVTAAWSYGLGSCYVGDVMERCDEMRDLLHLPEHTFPAVMLVLGYPTAQQQARPKPARAPMGAIVCRDAYREPDEAVCRELVSRRVPMGTTFEDWVSAFHERKYDSTFAREMTRSVGEYLEAFDAAGAEKV